MLEVDITIQDLPVVMADELRRILPGWFDHVERKFTMGQIMELIQFQLLFSKSDYVKQDAINAIKDRVHGKAVQKVQVEQAEAEPTEIKLPGGRTIII
jgi:predicted small metal-binding protein